jgi:hypothetical protein
MHTPFSIRLERRVVIANDGLLSRHWGGEGDHGRQETWQRSTQTRQRSHALVSPDLATSATAAGASVLRQAEAPGSFSITSTAWQ